VKAITFFMIVTDHDALMADYTIRSYFRIYDRHDTPWSGTNFMLFVYANCLSRANRKRYLPAWRKLPFVRLYDNIEKARSMHLKAGDIIVSPEGVPRERDSSCENYDELWTTELRKIDTPYYATVDADFEILDPGFYFLMMNELENDEHLVAYSCQYDPERVVYDSYSNASILLAERWHTCFCIYKKITHRCTVSHFYYQFLLPDGRRYCYDSAGNFQNHLIRTHGWKLKALGDEYAHHFIHYGAFSKNRSISPRNIGFYRRLAIAAQTGLLPDTRVRQTAAGKRAVRLVRRLAKGSLNMLFRKHIDERGRYRLDEPAYDGGLQSMPGEQCSSRTDPR
jgi:hypothetical protein